MTVHWRSHNLPKIRNHLQACVRKIPWACERPAALKYQAFLYRVVEFYFISLTVHDTVYLRKIMRSMTSQLNWYDLSPILPRLISMAC